MVKLKLNNKNPTVKGIAKRIPPKESKRSRKRKIDTYEDEEAFVPPPPKRNRSILDNATSSFSATAAGNAYGK